MKNNWIINKSDLILITGANGFIGFRVVKILLEYGFTRLSRLIDQSHFKVESAMFNTIVI